MRRRHAEEHENHERWLVSYADFITLLFAFFVVMYSVSSVNEGKYRVLSSSMEDAFHEHPLRGMEPIQVGEILRTLDPTKQVRTGDGILEDYKPQTGHESLQEGQSDAPEGYETGEQIMEKLEAMSDVFDANGVEVNEGESWIELHLDSAVLFGVGNATLSKEARPILNDLTKALSEYNNPIRVEGFTDNIPIRNAVFPSNWELSAGRAASVVNYLSRLSIDPTRLSAVGYGEHRPIATNETAEGRQKNRRIVLMISTDDEVLRADAAKRAAEKAKEETEPESIILHTISEPQPDGFDE